MDRVCQSDTSHESNPGSRSMIVCSMLTTEYERETHIENEERSLEILSNFHRVKGLRTLRVQGPHITTGAVSVDKAQSFSPYNQLKNSEAWRSLDERRQRKGTGISLPKTGQGTSLSMTWASMQGSVFHGDSQRQSYKWRWNHAVKRAGMQ